VLEEDGFAVFKVQAQRMVDAAAALRDGLQDADGLAVNLFQERENGVFQLN